MTSTVPEHRDSRLPDQSPSLGGQFETESHCVAEEGLKPTVLFGGPAPAASVLWSSDSLLRQDLSRGTLNVFIC